MLKTRDLYFDDYDPETLIGFTGIYWNGEIVDTKTGKSTVGDEEIKNVLDEELAEACGVSVTEIKIEIYDVKVGVFNDSDSLFGEDL